MNEYTSNDLCLIRRIYSSGEQDFDGRFHLIGGCTHQAEGLHGMQDGDVRPVCFDLFGSLGR